MRLAHVHPDAATGPGAAGLYMVAGLLVAAAYAAGAARLRRRGDAWSRERDASFAAGVLAIAWATAGPTPGGSFTGHMAEHLLVGMAGPLLICLARPLTLTLRALPAGPARRGLLALAHSRPVSRLGAASTGAPSPVRNLIDLPCAASAGLPPGREAVVARSAVPAVRVARGTQQRAGGRVDTIGVPPLRAPAVRLSSSAPSPERPTSSPGEETAAVVRPDA